MSSDNLQSRLRKLERAAPRRLVRVRRRIVFPGCDPYVWLPAPPPGTPRLEIPETDDREVRDG